MKKTGKLLLYLFIAAFVGLLDRITKLYAINQCDLPQVINKWLSCEFVINRGISFGMFHAEGTVQFTIVSIAIALITLLVAWIAALRWHEKKCIVGELLIITGSVSNILDRFLYNGVIDFISIYLNGFIWPLFNIADSCIILGTIIMLITYYRQG